MLLAGGGPLPQEKRDSVPGTLDNPLHLAIRRKDAYTVDVMLEKMKQVQGRASKIIHQQNGSGSTPLLLSIHDFLLTR